jgi:hypothetical protein
VVCVSGGGGLGRGACWCVCVCVPAHTPVRKGNVQPRPPRVWTWMACRIAGHTCWCMSTWCCEGRACEWAWAESGGCCITCRRCWSLLCSGMWCTAAQLACHAATPAACLLTPFHDGQQLWVQGAHHLQGLWHDVCPEVIVCWGALHADGALLLSLRAAYSKKTAVCRRPTCRQSMAGSLLQVQPHTLERWGGGCYTGVCLLFSM